MAYIKHDPALSEFIAYAPSLGNFKEAIANRKKFPAYRQIWLNSLKQQYRDLGITLPYADDVLLSENTFTVTTAHQPALLTGPLYHFYKISSILNLAKQLNDAYSENRFIPVFVLGTEDHDWAELNHFYLFNRKYEWAPEATGHVDDWI